MWLYITADIFSSSSAFIQKKKTLLYYTIYYSDSYYINYSMVFRTYPLYDATRIEVKVVSINYSTT